MSNKQFWFLLIGIIGGAILGYFGNVAANRKNNELLVQMLKDALDCTNNEIETTGRVSEERMEYLRQKRADLEYKLGYYSKKYNYYI